MFKVFGALLGVFILLTIGGLVLQAIGTAGQVASTPARVIERTVQTDNVIDSYNAFYTLKARYDARTQDIRNYTEVMAQETDPDQLRIQRLNIVAMKTACRDLVTRYNASSERLTSSWFRDQRLPQTLDMEGCE